MTLVTIDAATGSLVIDGQSVFPLGLSDPPPLAGEAPRGDAWAEVASAGVNFIRSGASPALLAAARAGRQAAAPLCLSLRQRAAPRQDRRSPPLAPGARRLEG